jgi:hypothetical protein
MPEDKSFSQKIAKITKTNPPMRKGQCLEQPLDRRNGIRTQESGVAGVQELKNLGFRGRFSRGDACPGFSDKDLAGIFCNSCNSCLLSSDCP